MKLVEMPASGAEAEKEDAVTFLESWLERAKDGEIRSIAVAAECHDGESEWGHSMCADNRSVITALAVVQSVLVEALK